MPGFYDDVRPISDEEKQQWASLPFDEEEYRKKEVGSPALMGSAYWMVMVLAPISLTAGFHVTRPVPASIETPAGTGRMGVGGSAAVSSMLKSQLGVNADPATVKRLQDEIQAGRRDQAIS